MDPHWHSELCRLHSGCVSVTKKCVCVEFTFSLYKQDCGSGSGPYSESGSGSRRAKMTHKSKKIRNIMFWSVGGSLLRAEGFFCNLDVLCEGLGIGKLLFLIQNIKNSSCKFFFSFWSSKPWIWISIYPKIIRIRIKLIRIRSNPECKPAIQ